MRKVALVSSSAATSSREEAHGEVNARSWTTWVGDRTMSPSEPFETCLGVDGGKTGGTCRRGETIGLAVAVFVAGIVKLILFRRGECEGLGEDSSIRVGLCDFGDAVLSPEDGLGSDSLDNRSTSVSLASPREDVCCVRGEF